MNNNNELSWLIDGNLRLVDLIVLQSIKEFAGEDGKSCSGRKNGERSKEFILLYSSNNGNIYLEKVKNIHLLMNKVLGITNN